MRRMYSEKGIIDTVNKGIQEGEISAGGVSPEQEAILDLMESDNGKLGIYSNGVLMSDANGDNVNFDFYIDEDNVANINSDYTINLESQAGVTVNGEPLPKILTLDFNSLSTLTLTNKQVTDITNEKYDEIKIVNYTNNNDVLEFLGIHKSSIALKWFNNNIGGRDNPTIPYIYMNRVGAASNDIMDANSYIGSTDVVLTGTLSISNNVLSITLGTKNSLSFISARGKCFGTGTTGELYMIASPKGDIPDASNAAYADVCVHWVNTSAYPHVAILFRVVAVHQSASGVKNISLYLTGEDYGANNQVTKYLMVMTRSGSKWNYTITTL